MSQPFHMQHETSTCHGVFPRHGSTAGYIRMSFRQAAPERGRSAENARYPADSDEPPTGRLTGGAPGPRKAYRRPGREHDLPRAFTLAEPGWPKPSPRATSQQTMVAAQAAEPPPPPPPA